MNREKPTDKLLEELFELLADQGRYALDEDTNSDPPNSKLAERIDLLICGVANHTGKPSVTAVKKRFGNG
jgi:hypothetical protein